jgi:hypothetical protein
MQPKFELRGKEWFSKTDLLDPTANFANDFHAGKEVLAGNGTQPAFQHEAHFGVSSEVPIPRWYPAGTPSESHLSGLISVAIENVIVSALRHFQKELLKTFFGLLGKQGYPENAPVSLFHRGSFFSSLLLQRLDYRIFKVSHKQLRHDR